MKRCHLGVVGMSALCFLLGAIFGRGCDGQPISDRECHSQVAVTLWPPKVRVERCEINAVTRKSFEALLARLEKQEKWKGSCAEMRRQLAQCPAGDDVILVYRACHIAMLNAAE